MKYVLIGLLLAITTLTAWLTITNVLRNIRLKRTRKRFEQEMELAALYRDRNERSPFVECWRCSGQGYRPNEEDPGTMEACPICNGSSQLHITHPMAGLIAFKNNIPEILKSMEEKKV